MFRKSTEQRSIFEPVVALPDAKAERLKASWADAFREHALPLIGEDLFAPMFHENNGRPNRPVRLVVGVLILKEIFGLTDEQALEHLEWNILWHHALGVTPDEAHLAQKTLHNFRVGMMEMDAGYHLFRETTDKILSALGTSTKKQRLDSTHITSNTARLTRLGLFCETIRLFLRALLEAHPRLFKKVPEELVKRYLKDDGATRYEGAKGEVVRRRLEVCARDLWRLIVLFRPRKASGMREFKLLLRLLEEQCTHDDGIVVPAKDDDDSGERGEPVSAKPPKEVETDSLQTPHDPNVTDSGHQGKGYAVQVAETVGEDNETEIITVVAVTPSCGSDSTATMPAIDELSARDIQPDELLVDTIYASAENAVQAEMLGTEVVGPVGGSAPKQTAGEGEITSADFVMNLTTQPITATCPAGHLAMSVETPDADLPERMILTFDVVTCQGCPLFNACPAKATADGEIYVHAVDLHSRNLEIRRRVQDTDEFRKRYAARAGIEATNSELKRAHGLGRLRVRGGLAVHLAVYLKSLACNIKRMVRALLARRAREMAAGAA